jgi:hypothetical protein
MFTLRWVGSNNDPDLFERIFILSKSLPQKVEPLGALIEPRIDRIDELARREPEQEKRKVVFTKSKKI